MFEVTIYFWQSDTLKAINFGEAVRVLCCIAGYKYWVQRTKRVIGQAQEKREKTNQKRKGQSL